MTYIDVWRHYSYSYVTINWRRFKYGRWQQSLFSSSSSVFIEMCEIGGFKCVSYPRYRSSSILRNLTDSTVAECKQTWKRRLWVSLFSSLLSVVFSFPFFWCIPSDDGRQGGNITRVRRNAPETTSTFHFYMEMIFHNSDFAGISPAYLIDGCK